MRFIVLTMQLLKRIVHYVAVHYPILWELLVLCYLLTFPKRCFLEKYEYRDLGAAVASNAVSI